ncbi:hypothetical protein AAGS40_04275 [Paraburkholderia sp. PREW-6R]|uniref:hypothetical protein n=1 Tax=Paraburkholderia sp. PREW-6R TaxID=3141544 RepID=UPI0031F5CDE3
MLLRRIAASLIAVFFVAAPPALQAAPTELASIAVSLVVQESCMVQSADAVISVANQPVVSCLHGAPFQISQGGFDPAAPTPEPARAGTTQPVAFVASRDAQQTVWMVNF